MCSPVCRVHEPANCHHYGHLSNGVHNNAGLTGACPNGPPAEDTWVELRVDVTGQTATVYMNGTYVFSFTTQYPPRPWVGISLPNGFSNILHFRNLTVVVGKFTCELKTIFSVDVLGEERDHA